MLLADNPALTTLCLDEFVLPFNKVASEFPDGLVVLLLTIVTPVEAQPFVKFSDWVIKLVDCGSNNKLPSPLV